MPLVEWGAQGRKKGNQGQILFRHVPIRNDGDFEFVAGGTLPVKWVRQIGRAVAREQTDGTLANGRIQWQLVSPA